MDELPIHTRMKTLVQMTIDVTEKQIEKDLKRLRKLKYGS